jgi:uncharacterized membrane protein
MLKLLEAENKRNETLFLGIISFLCFCLSIFRFVYTGSYLYLFLNWNLFLAFIPWILSSIIAIKPKLENNKIKVISLLLIWLLFFPNAPYILTDLLHLQEYSSMPKWFDLLLILLFAWVGILFGFFSLWNIEKILKNKMGNNWTTLIATGLLFLGSFGVYLGRYLRWNSWDIVIQPFHLLSDIRDRLVNPLHHTETWGMTLLMGILLLIIYWSFRLIRNNHA